MTQKRTINRKIITLLVHVTKLLCHPQGVRSYTLLSYTSVVGPCHHGMARPQVADRGTASNMEGSCE